MYNILKDLAKISELQIHLETKSDLLIWTIIETSTLDNYTFKCKGLGFKSCLPGQPLLGCFPEIRVLGLTRMLSGALKSSSGLVHVRHLIHSIRPQWFIPVVVSFWLLRRSKQTERPRAPPFPLPSSYWIR
jgi:hypothetical protein